MRLADRRGWTLRELLGRMDSAELSEWMAFDRIHPPPDPWAMHGVLCSLVWNLAGKVSKKDREPADFMPESRRPARRSSAAADLARFEQFAAAMAAAEAKAKGGG